MSTNDYDYDLISMPGNMVLRVHPENLCAPPCAVHAPSNHHMRSWALRWRGDRRIFERTCPHGIGHPDPDDANFHRRMCTGNLDVHTCDGCCVAPRICSHCQLQVRVYATKGDNYLCHTNEGMDCYRLVTVYKHSMPCTECVTK